jgi:hypothetical protein
MEPADKAKLHNTKGGSKDTELKELAVKPTKAPSGARAVTMVTPVANRPNARRKLWGVTASVAGSVGEFMGFEFI